jgi:hypothetical protein
LELSQALQQPSDIAAVRRVLGHFLAAARNSEVISQVERLSSK